MSKLYQTKAFLLPLREKFVNFPAACKILAAFRCALEKVPESYKILAKDKVVVYNAINIYDKNLRQKLNNS